MSPGAMKRLLGAGAIGLAASWGCASPRTPVSSALVWQRADLGATEELPVSPGDVLRIASESPVRVVDVTRGAEGEAEVARWVHPKGGVAFLRPSLGVTAMRFSKGTAVFVGAAKDPAFGWFDLEHQALAWAKSPLGTTFPALSASPRLDPNDARDLDAVLASAGAAPSDVVTAIRSIFALRAVHALEGVRSYPYARNEEIALPGAKRDVDERTFSELPLEHPAHVTVTGPSALVVFARAVRGQADAVAEVRVTEVRGARVRGSSRATVQRLAADGDLSVLRRVFVHVPPGNHTYEIGATGAPAWIAATASSPYLRVEDAVRGVANETRMLTVARRACEAGAAGAKGELAAVCTVALAFAGEDGGPAFERARAAASPVARQLAERIATGAPADRAAALESDASVGDTQALAQIARDAASSIDPSLRDAWWRGTSRGTSWETVDSSEERTWFAFLPRGAAGACPTRATPAATETELDASPATAFALPWRRVKAIRLLAVTKGEPSSPREREPIRLEVDGQALTAQPSSPRALWHIAVRGPTARVRRLDKGTGHVYVLSDDGCDGHGTLVHPASPLGTARELRFPAGVSAAGVEVWLAENAASQSFSIESADGKERVDVAARTGQGMVAIDEKGTRWRRVATLALPAWATNGARAMGSDGVALRSVARGIAQSETRVPVYAQPPDADALVALARKLTAAKTRAARGEAHLERALLLASYGFERAAMDDAALAKELGATASRGEDPVEVVRRSILPLPPAPLELATQAYGIEPDFDPPHAASPGARTRITSLDATLRQRGKGAPFDRALAVKAADAALEAPEDPRADTLVTLATSGSKWRLLRDVDGGGGRVPRSHTKNEHPVLDAEARIKPRILAGDPFGTRFVSITADRPARAFLADLGAAKARLDIVCVPRVGHAGEGPCPLKIVAGDYRVTAQLDADGRGTVKLPPGRGHGKGAELEVSLPETRADFVALLRVVLDRPAPGTTEVAGVGWVLDTPSLQYRTLLGPGRPIRIRPSAPGLLRIDAVPEEGGAGEIVCTIGARTVVVPANGAPKIVPVTKHGDVVIAARSGLATVAIAERVESEGRSARNADGASDGLGLTVRQLELRSARVSLEPDRIRDVAESSPRPLTWLEERLGTLESSTGGAARTLRDGAADKDLDAYAFQSITYRRRIESIGLYTLGSVLARVRDGAPTYGAAASFYEDIDGLRLRVTGTAGVFAQNVDDKTAYTVQPRGFVEYSGRLATDLFALPRIGYDGYYTTLASAPSSVRAVDDDVYNAFRFRRNSFAYVQGLLWYVPFFNDIFYLRARGTFDVTNGTFSHASMRPGTFFIFRSVELSAFVDAQYYTATAFARSKSSIDMAAGGGIVVHLPLTPGSFEIRPNATSLVRDDGGWQILAGLTLVASPRRGARDYSSLELAYPEETSGGIPWRNESRGP